MLGGTIMIGTLRETFPTFPDASTILSAIPELREERQGKRLIGVSALALNRSEAPEPERSSVRGEATGSGLPYPGQESADLSTAVRTLAMELKRSIGLKGTRVVFPPAKRPDLSTAQLLHNRLPKDGVAIFLLVSPERVDLVTVDTIQDIEAYARRDRGRPYADPGRGMLPPKVAQMLINLSLVSSGGAVYDPFCGVGTIPMEALLMGFRVIASDSSPTQVERTKENVAWVSEQLPSHAPEPQAPHVFVHDVGKESPDFLHGFVDAIVTEGWLGPARTSAPLPREADDIFQKVQTLLQNLLQSTEVLLKPGGRVVITLPAFRVKKRLLHFPLEKFRPSGWTQEPLVPDTWRSEPLFREASRGTLLYGRPDAIVLREIVRLRRTEKH